MCLRTGCPALLCCGLLSVCVLSLAIVRSSYSASGDWQIYNVHPFIEATADQLPQHLQTVARGISLTGLQNDWIHQSIAIAAKGPDIETVTVTLQGPPEISNHVRLRVVGFIKQDQVGYILDPIFDNPKQLDPSTYRQYMRNFENIHEFPTVTATQRDPVVIWITADTRHIQPGRYKGSITVEGGGRTVAIPLRLTVRPYAIPVENPLIVWGTQHLPSAPTREDGARLLLDYGINCCHGDAGEQDVKAMEIALAAGFRFALFVFGPSWHGGSPEEADLAAADRRIAQVKAFVERNHLKPNQWGFYLMDEPTDRSAPNLVKWCEYIRKQWPEARFWFDLGWGPGPRNEWSTVDGTVKPLLPYTSVWLAYTCWLSDDVSLVSIPLMKRNADGVWFYECLDRRYSWRPTVGRDWYRTAPWTAAKYKLQGLAWWNLNEYQQSPWDSKGAEAGLIYDNIPSRGLEALRQGFQEYKRVYELRRHGVDEAKINDFIDRAMNAKQVGDIDEVRKEMDDMLVARSS